MTQIISKENLHDPTDATWFALCEALALQHDSLTSEECDKLYTKENSVEVVFTVNGVELDFTHVMEVYRKSWNQCLVETAEELISDEMDDVIDIFTSTIEEADGLIRDRLKKRLNLVFKELEDE